MLSSFKISRGHNLSLDGVPNLTIVDIPSPFKIIIHPNSINGIKAKLLIKNGDNVKVGSPLFFDKKNPDALFVSSCSGEISHIILGERRIIKSIHIDNDNKYESINLNSTVSRESLLKSGLWTYIRQRLFSIIAKTDIRPKSIFISAMPTEPFAVDLDYLFGNSDNYLQKGIDTLKEIFNSDINFTSSDDSIFKNLNNVNHYSFNKLHPAGNIGVQIHHIDSIKDADDVRCYLSMQDLNRIGQFYSQEEYPIYKYIAVGGNAFNRPAYYKQVIGTPISDILSNNFDKNSRIISGDVLSGKATEQVNSLDHFDEILSIIKISNKRDFLGWLKPGFDKYSLSNTFLSKFISNKSATLNTNLNGSIRPIISMGNWENVLPMNILPEFLVKSILAKDIDMMEKLGIYECAPEDFSLCSFVCQSKVEVSSIIENGLKIMEEEA